MNENDDKKERIRIKSKEAFNDAQNDKKMCESQRS